MLNIFSIGMSNHKLLKEEIIMDEKPADSPQGLFSSFVKINSTLDNDECDEYVPNSIAALRTHTERFERGMIPRPAREIHGHKD